MKTVNLLDLVATVLDRCAAQNVTVQQARILLLLVQSDNEGGMTMLEMACELRLSQQSVRASLRPFMTHHLGQKIDKNDAGLSNGYVPVRWSLSANGRMLARQLFSLVKTSGKEVQRDER